MIEDLFSILRNENLEGEVQKTDTVLGSEYRNSNNELIIRTQSNLFGGEDYFDSKNGLKLGYSESNILGGHDTYDSNGKVSSSSRNIFGGYNITNNEQQSFTSEKNIFNETIIKNQNNNILKSRNVF